MQINGDNIKFNNLDELTSVLGTVGEDGSGNSNGAIFESGENANGSYVKLANGTMICYRESAYPIGTTTLVSTGVYRSGHSEIMFSSTFVGAPNVTFALNSNVNLDLNMWPSNLRGLQLDRVSIETLLLSSTVPAGYSYMLIAIGKWK